MKSSKVASMLLMLLLIASVFPVSIATATQGSSTSLAEGQSGAEATEAQSQASPSLTKPTAPLIPWNLIGKISKGLLDDIAGLQPEEKVRVLIRTVDGYQSILAEMLPEDAEVHFVYQMVPYVSATVKAGDVEWISDLPYVISVLPDEKVYLAVDSLSTPANTTLNDPYQDAFYLLNETNLDINSTSLWDMGYTGEGVVIAILDTGIEESHPDLDDMDDDPSTNDPKVIGEVSFVPGESADMPDIHWHGTHVASIAAGTGAASQAYPENASECASWWIVPPGTERGVAPGAYLLDVKVLSASGWGYDSWVLAGIEWAVNHGADIISMSLGGPMYSLALREACQAAIEKGVVVVAAAGNSGPSRTTVGFPGGFPEVISVGASSETSPAGTPGVIDFSSRGPAPMGSEYGEDTHVLAKPDVVAPGYMVMAAFAWYDTYQDMLEWYGLSFFDAWFYIVASGTSMATPHVSGAAALLLSAFPGATPEAIKAALTESAVDLGYPAMVQGRGLINVGRAYELLKNAPKGTYDQTELYMMNVSNYVCEHPLLPQDFECNLTLVVDMYTRLDRYNILGEELMSRGMHAITLSQKLEETYQSFYVELEEPIESPHPYYDDMWEVYTVTHPGAASISVHFTRIDVEENYDYVYVYDENWNLIVSYTGYLVDVWTPPVPGDTVYIVLSTDYTITYWGFQIDAYRYTLPTGFWLPFVPPLEVYASAAGCNSTTIMDVGANYMVLNVSINLEGYGDNATINGEVYSGPYSYTGLIGLPVSEVNITVCSDNSTVEDDKEAQVLVYGYYVYPVTKNVLEYQGIDILYIPDLLDPEALSELLPPEAVAAWVEQGGSLLFEGDDVWPPKMRYNIYTSYYNVTWSPNAEGRVYDTTDINTTAFPTLTEDVDTLSVGGAVASLLVDSPAVPIVRDNFGNVIVAAGIYGEGKFVVIAPDMIINDLMLGGLVPFLTGLGDNLQFALNIFYWFTGSEKGKGSVEGQLVHDLAISWLSYPTLVTEGEPLNFSAEIVNTGHYTENFTLWVYVYNCTWDIVFNGTRTYTNLENGTSIIDTWSFTPNLVRGVNDTVGLSIYMRIEYEYEFTEEWPCNRNNEIGSKPNVYWIYPPGAEMREHGIWATVKAKRAGPSPILTSATPGEIDGTTGMFVIMYPFDLNLLSISFYTSGALADANVTITGNVTEIVSFWNTTAVEIIDNPLIPVGPATLIGPGSDVMPVEDMPRGTVIADLYMWTPLDVELGTYMGEIILYNGSDVLYAIPITLEIREPVGTVLYEDLSWAGVISSYIWPWMEYYTFWTEAAEAGCDVDLHFIVFWEAFTMYMEAIEDWLSLKPWERETPPNFIEIYLDLLESLDYDAYMVVEPWMYYMFTGEMFDTSVDNVTEWCQETLETLKDGSIFAEDDPDWYFFPFIALYEIVSSSGSLLTLANTPEAGYVADYFIRMWYLITLGEWNPDIQYYPHMVYDPVVSRADGEIGVEEDHYIFEGKDTILWTYETYGPHGVYVGLTDTNRTTVMAVGLNAYSEPPYSRYDYANYAVIHEADCSEGAYVSGSELVALAGYDLFSNEILEYGDLYLWYSYPFLSWEDRCLASTWEAGNLGDNVRLLEQMLELLCNRPPEKEVAFDKDEYTAGEEITVTLNVTEDFFSAEEVYVEASLYLMYFNKTLFELYPTKPWMWYEWDVVDSVNGTYAEMGTFTLTIPKSALNQTGTVTLRIYDGYGDEVCQAHEVEIINRPPVVTSVTPSEFLVTPGDEVSLQIEVTDDSSSPEDIEVFVWIKYVDYVDVEHEKIKCPILVKTSSLKQMATYEDGVFTVTFDTYPGPDSYWKWPAGRYIAVVIAMDEAGPISPYDFYKERYEEGYELKYFIHYGVYPSMIEEAIRLYMQENRYVDWEKLQNFIDNFGTIDYLPMITSRLWRTWAASIIESTTFIVNYEPTIIGGEIKGLYDGNEAMRNSTLVFVVYAIDDGEGLDKTATFKVYLPDGTTETIPGEFAGRTSDGKGAWAASYSLTGKPKGSYYVEATVKDLLGTSTTTVIGTFNVVDILSSMISINIPPGATAEDVQEILDALKEIAEMIGNWTGVTAEIAGYNVGTLTTSTLVEPPKIVGNVIELHVAGPEGTVGTSVIVLQKSLLEDLGVTINDMVVLFDGEPIEPDEVKEYPTYYTVKVTYTHSEHVIAIHFTGNVDSDGDGVKDWKEYVTGANPLKSDTDGDLWNDNIDMWPTDPLLPNLPITVLIAVAVAVAYYLLVARRRVVIT